MKIKLIILVVVLLAVLGGVYFFRSRKATQEAAKVAAHIATTVVITSPKSGETVSGVIPVTASASGTDKIKTISIFVDGKKRMVCVASPCTYLWRTVIEATGSHVITAEADHGTDTPAESLPLSVLVAPAAVPEKPAAVTTATTPVKKPIATVPAKTPAKSTAPIPAKAAPLPTISAIAITDGTASSETITWKTNVATMGSVVYGPDTSLSGTYASSSPLETSGSLLHSVTLTGLTSGKKYYYRVKVTDTLGNSVLSTERTFTVASVTISAIKSDFVSDAGATITWTTNIKTTGQVLYDTGSMPSGLYGFSTPLTSNLETSHTIVLSKLSANTKYYYRVVSIDSAGNKNISSENTFTTSLIFNVTTQTGYYHSGVTVNWSTSVITKSEIKYGTQTSSTGVYPYSVTDNNLLSYHSLLVPNLEPATKYYYRILATDADGKKTTSIEYSFTTS